MRTVAFIESPPNRCRPRPGRKSLLLNSIALSCRVRACRGARAHLHVPAIPRPGRCPLQGCGHQEARRARCHARTPALGSTANLLRGDAPAILDKGTIFRSYINCCPFRARFSLGERQIRTCRQARQLPPPASPVLLRPAAQREGWARAVSSSAVSARDTATRERKQPSFAYNTGRSAWKDSAGFSGQPRLAPACGGKTRQPHAPGCRSCGAS